MFRALPDLDFVVVVDYPPGKTMAIEQDIASIAARFGYHQSDLDIYSSIKTTQSVLDALRKCVPPDPKHKIPLDIHVWPQSAFEEAMQLLLKTPNPVDVRLISRALHSQWEDHPLPFFSDFIFSFTEIEVYDDSLMAAVASTRRRIRELYSVHDIIHMLCTVPRIQRILQSDAVRDILSNKIERW